MKNTQIRHFQNLAEYAIPIATGCMGHCHYCYLHTTLGQRPYIRVYVNLDEIFTSAKKYKKYIEERAPNLTRFEAACTFEPVGIEHTPQKKGVP
jgi:spore photoproduct lyase